MTVQLPDNINLVLVVVILIGGYTGKRILDHILDAILTGLAKAINPKKEADLSVTQAEHALCRQNQAHVTQDVLARLDKLSEEFQGLRRLVVASLTREGKALTPKDLKDLGVM